MTGTLNVSKPVNTGQLQTEMAAASVDYGMGLLFTDGTLYAYTPDGIPGGFADPAAAQLALDAHVAMRNKTSEEYAVEFQNPDTTPARRQEIRDIQNGLLPTEQVPMTQEEWDKQHGSAP